MTKLLSKKDKEYHSEAAKQALRKEVTKLLDASVWDETALSRSKMAETFVDAAFSRLFHILGNKK